MNWRPVQSSNVQSADYDDNTHTLTVKFSTGAVYAYADVPLAVWNALQASPSVGAFLHKQIRPFYVGTKVEVETKAGPG